MYYLYYPDCTRIRLPRLEVASATHDTALGFLPSLRSEVYDGGFPHGRRYAVCGNATPPFRSPWIPTLTFSFVVLRSGGPSARRKLELGVSQKGRRMGERVKGRNGFSG